MSIIICGAGRVGYNIAQYLTNSNLPVTVIDNDIQVVKKITDELDVQAVCGCASDPNVLERAGAENASVIIAVTQIDEVNMVICEIAHALYGIKNKIARVRNHTYLDPRWAQIFNQKYLAVDHVISPEAEIAKAVCDSLTVPGAFVVYFLADNQVKVVGVKCRSDAPVVNTPIERIPSLFPQIELTVLGLSRDETHIIPDDQEILRENDDVYLCFPEAQTSLVMEAFGLQRRTSQRLFILGGGQIGYNLAKRVEDLFEHIDVRIIESNRERAQLISKDLNRTIVIHGDALDSDVLEESDVGSADLVVALTQDDKVNTLSALLAKRFGASKVLALIINRAYATLVPSLGIDGVVNPRAITVSRILQSIKSHGIRAVYSLRENLGEVLEIDIHENSVFMGKTVQEITRDYGVKVGAIVRDGEFMMPLSKLTIHLTDRVILMVSKTASEKIEQLLSEIVE